MATHEEILKELKEGLEKIHTDQELISQKLGALEQKTLEMEERQRDIITTVTMVKGGWSLLKILGYALAGLVATSATIYNFFGK